jgi:hypothetical protein
MGRKGVSKRKPAKSKVLPVSNASAKGAVTSIMHASESSASQTIGSGAATTNSKGGKPKTSDSQQANKKR